MQDGVYKQLGTLVSGEPLRAIEGKDAYSYPAGYHFGVFERNDLVSLDASILQNEFNGKYCDTQVFFHRFSRELAREGRKQKTRIQIHAKTETDCEIKLYSFVREPQYMEFTMKNQSKEPLTVGMQLRESINDFNGPNPDICSWELPERYVLAPKQEKVLRFSFEPDRLNCLNSNSKAKKPAYCASVVCAILLSGIRAEIPYDFLLSDDELYFGYAPEAEAEITSAGDIWDCGSEVGIEINTLRAVCGEKIDLELRKNDRTMWRARLSDEEKSALDQDKVVVNRSLPWYLSPGRYTVGLVADGYRVRGGELSVSIENKGHYELPVAERKMYKGLPTLFVNGEPCPFCTYSSPIYKPEIFTRFGRAGTNVISIELPVGAHFSKQYEDTLIAPGVYDFSSVDEMIGIALQANPDAYLLIRCYPTMPWFWFQENDDQRALIKTDRGNIAPWEENGEPAASLASEKWLAAQSQTFRDFIAYIREQPWCSRVIGFHITGGATCEWFAWGSNYDGAVGSDFSRINQEKFKRWLIEHGYELPAGDPVPPLETRIGRHSDILPDTKESILAAAYSQYYSDLLFQTMERLARTVKEASDNRLIVGTFYGYVFQLSGESRQALSYSLAALSSVLKSPYIDYIGGVPLHTYRYLDGYDSFVSVIDSVTANGKLYYNENDLFSWLHPIHWNVPYDDKDPRAGAISMHRRVMANDAVHGALLGWFGLADSWHNDEELLADFAKQMQSYKDAAVLDRTPASEVAIVIDDTSFTWVSAYTSMPLHNNTELLFEAAKTGRPVSTWILEDIDKIPERVKFIMVSFAFAAKPGNIEKLRRVIEQGGRTILVIGAPGYIDPTNGNRSIERVSRLLELPLRDNMAIGRWDKLFNKQGECLCPTTYMPCPRFELKEEGCLRFAEGFYAGTERSLVRGGRLIWCGTAPLSRNLLDKWMTEAGAHRYAPMGFTVNASKQVVSVTAPTGGPEEVELDFGRPVKMIDMMDGFTGEGRKIRCNFLPGQTRLFALTEGN